MSGIYIHIPFCKQKCHYCNFFSVATSRWKDAFLRVLMQEIRQKRDYLAGDTVHTIYLGGGTPSLLKTDEIIQILTEIYRHYPVYPDAEITLEANPDDLTEQKAAELRNTPVNRLSIGIQSFFDTDLMYLNRVHDSKQGYQAIENARKAGFANLTIDLMYGMPTLSDEKWKHNLESFFSLEIPHLSAYSLTVEQKTPLDLLIRRGEYQPVDDRQSAGHFRTLLEMAREKGFIHYEISNFSKEGYYSRHNSLYWLGGNYLGLGPSAHSFNGHSRQWNVSNISKYLLMDDPKAEIEEMEVLTAAQRYNEYVMTSLRTIWGCDTEHIRNVFGDMQKDYFLKNARKFLERNFLYQEGTRFFLTDEGKLFADGISAELFADQ